MKPFTDAIDGRRLLWTATALGGLLLIRAGIVRAGGSNPDGKPAVRRVFWTRQLAAVATLVLSVVIVGAIWLESPARLLTIAGIGGAGLAFALQRVITAFAGYLIILRGNTFTVGDRISMGGVRGDVINLGFLQTTILETGAPRDAEGVKASWIRDRQHTGRLVTVTNDKVFEEPVFNYTREFPFMWEELQMPVKRLDERDRLETILLDAARAGTERLIVAADEGRRRFEGHYSAELETLEPRVFYNITEGKLDLHVRFVTNIRDHRPIKDAIERDIIRRITEAGLHQE